MLEIVATCQHGCTPCMATGNCRNSRAAIAGATHDHIFNSIRQEQDRCTLIIFRSIRWLAAPLTGPLLPKLAGACHFTPTGLIAISSVDAQHTAGLL